MAVVIQRYRVVNRVRDKRSDRRVSLIQDIECEGEAGKFSKRLADISVSGMFVDTLSKFAPGATVAARFQLPGSAEPVLVSAKVVYVQEKIGAGLEFLDLKSEDRRRIEELVGRISSLRRNNSPGNVCRVLVSIPVTLKGTAKNGMTFVEPAIIVMLSKNGASIQTEVELDLDATVFMIMPAGSEFEGRVLGLGREEAWIQCRSLPQSLGFRFP